MGRLSNLAVQAARRAAQSAEKRAVEAAEGAPFRVPRPRQKPVVRTDNPGGDWLKYQRINAAENVDKGRTKVSGAVTGYLKKPIELDPRKLEEIPGAMDERRVPGDYQYDALRPLIEAEGFRQDSPILVGVNHLGDPYIIEGNTRAAVARDLGIDRIPAEVRYFAGGEGVEGPMMPSLLEKYMPPSELSLDPNFRRFFEGSQAVDEYDEPIRFYHGTASDVPSFSGTVWGSRDPKLANEYAAMRHFSDPASEGGNVIPIYMRASNTFDADQLPKTVTVGSFFNEALDQAQRAGRQVDLDQARGLLDRIRGHALREESGPHYSRHDFWNEAASRFGPEGEQDINKLFDLLGYDSVSMLEDGVPTLGVFDPRQVKSAIGNRGTYDPNDPDINKKRGGLAVKKGKR